jgi:CRP-like cAMP-binding protein
MVAAPIHLEDVDLDALSAYAARATWPAGFAVYQRGAPADGVFAVLRGAVLLRSRVRAARGFIPWVATAGETFGSEGLATGAVYATDARAEAESETLFLSTEHMRAFVREQPKHALALISQLMAERAALLEKLRELTTLSVEQRLIATLARLSATGTFVGEDGRIALNAQRYRLLCELVGATRESVSLVLGRLTAQGYVERSGSTHIIRRVSELTARSEDGLSADVPLEPLTDDGTHQERQIQ